jgi:hypothetical protein
MRSRYAVFILLMVMILGCASTPPVGSVPPAPVYSPPAEVDVNMFYEDLAPYGTWLWLEDYGRVWQPHGVSPGWRPYTEGRWVFTEAGWTWVSDWEWGWAPFHYGRWLHAPAYGWVWVPGSVWGPAWVVWHHGAGWVGWAPLPPAVVWEPAGHLRLTHVERHIHPSQFCFVRERDILAPRVHRHIVPHTENTRLVRVTRNVTHYTIINKQVVNQSLRVDSVEQAAKQPVPRLRIVETDARQGVRKGQVREQEGQVRLFRPTVGRALPDTERPKALSRPRPSVVPERESQTPPAASAPVIRTPPAPESPSVAVPPAAPAPPQLSPSQEELQRQRSRRPPGLSRPPASTPQVRTPPASGPREQRDRDQSRSQQRQLPADRQPPGVSQPPLQQESPSRGQPRASEVHREPRGRRMPQGQQEQDNEGATRGNVPPATGSGMPAAPSGTPSQHSTGSRGRW